MATGARVRNAYRICPLLGDSLAKVRLIPDVVMMSHDMMTKGLPVTDDDASDKVDGGVTAHHADDQ